MPEWFEFDGCVEKNSMTGVCATCGFPLTAEYPDDYPDEWKFCCSCFKWAKRIAYDNNFFGTDKIVKGSPILKRIFRKITLVKGNEIIRRYCQ